MMPAKLITMPYLLVVEGKDDEVFLRALLQHLGYVNVDIRIVEGKNNFKRELHALLLDEGFERNVKSYAIVRDADTSLSSTLRSIQNTLKELNEPVPQNNMEFASSSQRRVGICILPGTSESGTLEDLCLATVSDHPVLECVDEYLKCLNSHCVQKPGNESADPKKAYFPRNPAKAKTQALMAGLYDSPAQIGTAARKGYWDFDHPGIAHLRDFLNALCR